VGWLWGRGLDAAAACWLRFVGGVGAFVVFVFCL